MEFVDVKIVEQWDEWELVARSIRVDGWLGIFGFDMLCYAGNVNV